MASPRHHHGIQPPKQFRVLVVDDQMANCIVLERQIKLSWSSLSISTDNAIVSVDRALSGAAAKQKAKEQDYDLIFMDYSMPPEKNEVAGVADPAQLDEINANARGDRVPLAIRQIEADKHSLPTPAYIVTYSTEITEPFTGSNNRINKPVRHDDALLITRIVNHLCALREIGIGQPLSAPVSAAPSPHPLATKAASSLSMPIQFGLFTDGGKAAPPPPDA